MCAKLRNKTFVFLLCTFFIKGEHFERDLEQGTIYRKDKRSEGKACSSCVVATVITSAFATMYKC